MPEGIRQIKNILMLNLLLMHFDLKLDIILAADVSDYGIGAVLLHNMTRGVTSLNSCIMMIIISRKELQPNGKGSISNWDKYFYRFIHGRIFHNTNESPSTTVDIHF